MPAGGAAGGRRAGRGGNSIYRDLRAGQAVNVTSPSGTRFTIKPREFGGVRGYAVIPEGQSRGSKSRIMSASELQDWTSTLRRRG